MPWIALGTLVVIHIDEGDHLQAVSAQSTPFVAPLEWCSAHSAWARIGVQIHLRIQKWSKIFFSKLFLSLLGSSNKWG